MADYTSAFTGADIDASVVKSNSAVQPAYTGDLAITGNESISGNLNFTGTSNRITGNFSSTGASLGTKACFQSSTTNGATNLQLLPNGTSTGAGYHANNNSDPTNSSRVVMSVSATSMFITSTREGTGNYLPINIGADAATALFITASGTSTAGSDPLVLIRANSTTDTVTPLQVTGAIKLSVYTVATLPVGTAGCRSFVSDANATTFASIVAGGGANFVPVYHDGTNWRIG